MNSESSIPNLNYVLLYVENPLRSEQFYANILERQAIESSPSFVMFSLGADVKLGLWAAEGVEPKADARGGGSEIVWTARDAGMVDDTHASWTARGVMIAQKPCQMDFGYTFTALDPDGHRIRVFAR